MATQQQEDPMAYTTSGTSAAPGWDGDVVQVRMPGMMHEMRTDQEFMKKLRDAVFHKCVDYYTDKYKKMVEKCIEKMNLIDLTDIVYKEVKKRIVEEVIHGMSRKIHLTNSKE